MKDNREFKTPPPQDFQDHIFIYIKVTFLKKEQNVSQVKDVCRLKNVQVFPLQSQIFCLIIQLPPASHPQLCFMSVLLNQTSQNNPVPLQIKKKKKKKTWIHFIPNCFKSKIYISFSHFFLGYLFSQSIIPTSKAIFVTVSVLVTTYSSQLHIHHSFPCFIIYCIWTLKILPASLLLDLVKRG